MGWECSQGELALSPPGLFDLLHTYLSLSHLSTAWSCSGTGDSEVPAESAQVLFYFFFLDFPKRAKRTENLWVSVMQNLGRPSCVLYEVNWPQSLFQGVYPPQGT